MANMRTKCIAMYEFIFILPTKSVVEWDGSSQGRWCVGVGEGVVNNNANSVRFPLKIEYVGRLCTAEPQTPGNILHFC